MLSLISCYNKNEQQLLDKILADAIVNVKCMFIGHYSTVIVLNRSHYILTALKLDAENVTASVWELELGAGDEPIMTVTTNLSSAVSFKNIIPNVITALRRLKLLHNHETIPL